ncbi:hypothetical protein [Caulobacter sp. 602-1]|uniref:hypothetical protein n=1 Tax=Caulobacter sp. 602-1 TaxID=2492472 RepID=UPI000F635E30|nr:hypothetical protein [Caulobacter sp. 602-1]RRN64682.1 hypothetical protein EIK80_11645 [Caulobacter sp. 602-1]
MSERKDDPTTVSRRTLLGAAPAAPLACKAGGAVAAAPAADSLLAQCAQWLTVDFESDRLARRWGALEILAASGYDYFRMTERQRGQLPMAPEMAALEVQMDELWKERKRGYQSITQLVPCNIHEVASLLVIAARMDVHDPGETAPLVRKAIEFLASAKCPGCGEPYVPPSLPTA